MPKKVPTALPKSYSELLTHFCRYIYDALSITQLSVMGVLSLRHCPESLQKAIELEYGKEWTTDIGEYQATADEVARDNFFLIWGHATLSIWTGLESYVKDFIRALLINQQRVLDHPDIKAVTNEYPDICGAEFATKVLERFRRDKKYSGPDIDRFESWLSACGLGGDIDNEVRTNLVELQNVRRCFAHKKGIADKELVRNCPELGYKAGDKIRLTMKDIDRYASAALSYAIALLDRLQKCSLDSSVLNVD